MRSTSGAINVRQQNLARVLRLVHLSGPLSRAALTEATGLNRSTIADLVAQLSDEGLVAERDPDPSSRVGRPSNIVVADPRVVAIAANPEVDAITIAAVGLDREIRVSQRIEMTAAPTATDAADVVSATIQSWTGGPLHGSRIVGVGLAVPGLVRARDGLVRSAPHLGWTDAPIADHVRMRTGLPVAIENDASFGALAEHRFGAARGHDYAVYLNGGASGIGGGLIVHGQPTGGAMGYAGEFGQNRPGIGSDADRTARDGVLEDEVSRARLLSYVGLTSADEPTLAAALRNAQPPAHHEMGRQRRILATALANAVNVLNPTVVVLGGHLATLAESDMDELRRLVVAQAMPATMEDVEIRVASLGEDRLLIGAAEGAFEALLNAPTGGNPAA
ncbi:ROK family transcriptional regulator [Microbacterium sp. C7(2022)]|uniref:ROK family transcriptional regulator n=1 Tax=Microbacterium sp. C7(2022) TaxID=2992759 RepID=UPI00237B8022|nr:ROK family transcriptional regulator [Microbacterium sp. C7(2022)]MDE0545234.1 ROK family transcriptional regulator [Microbacterium sp. C7(2022)]